MEKLAITQKKSCNKNKKIGLLQLTATYGKGKRMKKLVCGTFGTIYYAQILKDGLMSDTNRVNVTDDAIQAVLMHLMSQTEYRKEGHFGYQYGLASGEKACVIAYDPKRYVLAERKEE